MKNGKTIGIAGGGQLGRMLTDAAHNLGFKVVVLDPTTNSPAGQVADEQIIGSFKDKDKILELASKSDFLTFEIEGISIEGLEQVEWSGKPVNPKSKIIKVIKDKFAQKEFLAQKGIPVAEFALIENKEDARRQGELWGYPFLLKARFDAYDGRGNFVIKSKNDIDTGFDKLSKSSLYAEKFFPFKKELAVIVARDMEGHTFTFEPVETIHENNICHIVMHPADISPQTKIDATMLATRIVNEFDGIGIFAVEMFMNELGGVAVNEIAPRVHNSGHHTIEAYTSSQFELHIRAIAGLPLGESTPRTPASVMINILGERDGEAKFENKNQGGGDSAHIHLYGKMETRKERKMGHITVLGENVPNTLEKAKQVRKNISI